MSEFNRFARELDDLAAVTFAEIRRLDDDLEQAATERRETHARQGLNAEAKAAALAADAKYQAARMALHDFRMKEYRLETQARTIRDRLADALTEAAAVNPADVDNKVVFLLNSGILNVADYRRLMTDAQKAGNPTMIRLIGAAADKAAETIRDGGGGGDAVTAKRNETELRQLAIQSREVFGGDRLADFDALLGLFGRTLNNHDLIGQWGEIAGGVIEDF